MSTHCQTFCTRPLRPGDEFGDENWNACCADCKPLRRWLSREVLPAIMRHGYYAPADATAEQELTAMVEQAHLRDGLREAFTPFDSIRLIDGRTLGEFWDERPGGDA